MDPINGSNDVSLSGFGAGFGGNVTSGQGLTNEERMAQEFANFFLDSELIDIVLEDEE